MKRDIFIDNNIASKFNNPADVNYKELTKWLLDNHNIPSSGEDDRAYLVVSNKLLAEYGRSCSLARGATAITIIVDKLTKDGRLIKINNNQIKDFKAKYFTKTIQKKLQSNTEDREHIPVVLLSNRKYALIRDKKFASDLKNFPGFIVLVSDRPENIPYK